MLDNEIIFVVLSMHTHGEKSMLAIILSIVILITISVVLVLVDDVRSGMPSVR